ncbi:hypothetical protein EJ06DRAFT_549836 [Trichodelitschia bisporula]|uniref:DUF7918 domain-containing protein n=1 Tax=Trichodelitschia bisporula TaxID=703511 RepID=A0A6G1HTF6_9PEZI|nr:hypothetical protein EJ06DRAFT_549836 [Trichodelitschia bisporula]
MAILPGLPGLNVTIVSNGETLPEYSQPDGDDAPQPRTTVCYIESKAGQYFEIRVQFDEDFTHRKYDINVRPTLDGRALTGLVPSRGRLHPVTLASQISFIDGRWVEQNYMFTNLVTVDDQSGQRSGAQDLGKIEVRLHRCEQLDLYPGPSEQKYDLEKKSIAEKALKGKAISHSATLGQPKTIKRPDHVRINWIDTLQHPFATFEFRYRSKRDLETEYIIPRAEEKKGIDRDGFEMVDQPVKSEDRTQTTKRKLSTAGGGPTRSRIKREVETIDLTD